MGLEVHEQIFELIDKSKTPLIVLRPDCSVDAFSSGLALQSILYSLGKTKVSLVSHNFKTPQKLSFLPKSTSIKSVLESVRQFIISVDIGKTKVDTISYSVKDDSLDFIIRPKDGMIHEEDITTRYSGFVYDLIITLGAPDLESLGELYDRETDLFFETPIINFDFRPENEGYGQINMVDVTASSVSEIIGRFFHEHNTKVITEDVATLLLCGMMAETKLWHTSTVTPRVLSLASTLMEMGGRKEEIMEHLYRSRNLTTLRLWGRVLARLQYDKQHSIAWSTIPYSDFQKTNASDNDLDGVVDELISTASDAQVIFLIYQRKDGVFCGYMYSPRKLSAQTLAEPFKGKGSHNHAEFCLDAKEITVAEKKVLTIVRQIIKKETV